MGKKAYPAKRRLQRILADHQKKPWKEILAKNKIDPAELAQKFDLSPPPTDWRRPITPALKKAAQAFGLDPESQGDRDLLLKYFAEAHYGQGKPGAPRKLDENQLLKDISNFQES
jgi:hypothetical protein